MVDVRRRVQSEIAAGLIAGVVHFAKPASFLLCDPRNLGLVRVKSSQGFTRSRLLCRQMEKFDQIANLCERLMGTQVAIGPHAFHKVQPQIGVRH